MKIMKKDYGLRSGILHDGKIHNISIVDTKRIEITVANVIISISKLTKKISTEQDLDDYFMSKVFSEQ